MVRIEPGEQLTDSGLVARPGFIASEPIRAGDYCRVIDGSRVRRLRDGDGLRMTDVMAVHDAKVGEAVTLVSQEGG